MEDGLTFSQIEDYGRSLIEFLSANVFTYDRLGELGAIAAAFMIALALAPRLRRLLTRLGAMERLPVLARDGLRLVRLLALPGLWLILQWFTLIGAREIGHTTALLLIAVNLLVAWVVIRLASRLIRQTVWSNLVFVMVWTVVAVNVLGLSEPLVTSLDRIALTLGTIRISVYTVIKGVVSLGILLWATTTASRFLADRIRHIEDLTPSLQVLLSKLLQFVLITIAIVLALSIVGIDLTALTVFGGALGIGIGLGLQKAASNIMGGLMLLLDKSIKPGDVISVGGTFGWVTSLGGRYVSVRTRDGIEHLIPNEVFISNGVENWSFSDRAIRIKIPIGVSYKSDVHKAIALCIEAANQIPRVIDTPTPICIIVGFGDSSVDLELRCWIRDPENGVANVRGAVFLKVWDLFQAEGIEIPFPQRDIHIKQPAEIRLADGAPSAPRLGAADAV